MEAQQLNEAAAELPTAEGQRAKDFVVRDGRDGWFATEAFSTAAGVWDRHGLYPGRLRQGLPQGQISAVNNNGGAFYDERTPSIFGERIVWLRW